MAGSSTMQYPRERRLGFTLIEVALGATILAVGFVGMVEALALGSEMLDTAREQTNAAQIMQGEIEYWRLQPWATIIGSSGLKTNGADILANYPEFSSTSLAMLAASLTGSSFKFSRTVTYVSGRSNLILQVQMTVTWTSVTGKTHSRSMNSYIGRYGLNVSYQKL
jgi:Tfp pilus assembly protein PilV